MTKYYGIDINAQREGLINSTAVRPIIEEAIAIADKALEKTYPALKFSDYMLFFTTGDRKTFDTKQVERRIDALSLALALWLTGDEEKYLTQLVDLLHHICDEFTWCIAAHTHFEDVKKTPEWYEGEVDLFNARTAIMLCDVYTIAGDKLPTLIKERIALELRRRVIEPTKRKVFHWESWYNNWLAYCVLGMSLSTALFGTEEEMKELLPRFVNLCDRYLSGFGEDFCCLEGGSYWTVFREFLRIAVVLKDATRGEVDFLSDPRVKEIAVFPTKTAMTRDTMVSFSDAEPEFFFDPGCMSFLNKLYPGELYLGDIEKRLPLSNSMGLGIATLLWADPDYAPTPLPLMTSIFPKSEWYISRREKFSFAAKGGHNEEEHNHNDVGSFMAVTPKGQVPLRDIGTGLYTRQYFDDSVRYTILNNGSHGHSVPMVNGTCQGFGSHFRAANTTADENYFETDIAGAYEKGLVEKILRRFEVSDNGFVMKDVFTFSPSTTEFTERIAVSPNPTAEKGRVTLDGAVLLYDWEKYNLNIRTETYAAHTGKNETATFLDFTPISDHEREFEIKVMF